MTHLLAHIRTRQASESSESSFFVVVVVAINKGFSPFSSSIPKHSEIEIIYYNNINEFEHFFFHFIFVVVVVVQKENISKRGGEWKKNINYAVQ